MQNLPQWRGSRKAGLAAAEGGFTLVELMVTLAIAVVLIAIAVPSFRSITLSNRLTTAANDVVNAISTARMEAIKHNGSVQLCSNSSSANTTDKLGSQCGTLAGAVVAMTGTDTFTTVRDGITGLASPLQMKGDMKALRFNGQGQGMAVGGSAPYTGPVVDICTDSLGTGNHRIISIAAGSVVKTTTSDGACSS